MVEEFDLLFVYNHLFEIVTYQQISFKIVCQKFDLLHKSMVIATVTSKSFAVGSRHYHGCMLASAEEVYCPLSLDKPECLPWSAHNTVQKAYMWIGTWNSKFLHYKAVYTAYSCIMQVYNTTYVQVHGVLVLVHTNTRLYQNPQFMKSKSHISK